MAQKVFTGLFLTCFMIFSFNSMSMAKPVTGEKIPNTFLNIYQMDNTTAVGLKQKISNRFFLTSDIEYVASSNDLEFQMGATYFIPYKVDLGVFFDQWWTFNIYLYPGAGVQYFRNTGEKSGYLVLGVNYLIFFSESIYPFAPGKKPELRTGLSFSL